MTKNHEHRLAEEHPRNRLCIPLLFVFFMIIWIPDSFLFNFSTFLRIYVPLWFHVIPGIIIFVIGLIFIERGAHYVFHNEGTGVISIGIFTHVRHPIYLGLILLFLGGTIATLSLLSLIPVITSFFVLNRMAAYEEEKLQEKFGNEYLDYKKKVRRWIPR